LHGLRKGGPWQSRFGTVEQVSHRYLTLDGLIVVPFVDIARRLLPAKRPLAAARRAPDV